MAMVVRVDPKVVGLRIRNTFIEWCLARAAVCAAKVLFATLHRQLLLADPSASPYVKPSGTHYIYCVWHDSLLMPLFLGKQSATTAMVGRHRDGGFLAMALAALGIPAVRGSSSKGGSQAVRQLLNEAQTQHIVVTPDGPRGPRRTMKPGVAYLASRTGRPVVPTAFACRRFWSVGKGWTNLVVPQPWTTVYALTGPSIHVPPQANRDELHDYTQQIQHEMDQLNTHAARLAACSTNAQPSPGIPESAETNDTDLCRQPGLRRE